MMKPQERQELILAQLLEHPSLHIDDLRERFQVSEGTIRNDLRALEAQGKLIRTHGGAVSTATRGFSPVAGSVTGETVSPAHAHHAAIARRAREMISEGDVIALSSGPISLALAQELLPMKSLVVLTNSLEIAGQLSHNPQHTVILIGGQMKAGQDSLFGPLAATMLDRMRVSKAFISCDGISVAQGAAGNDLTSAQVKAAMVASADTVVMMSSGDAVGRLALISFATLSQVTHLITTNEGSQDAVNALIAAGVRVSVCGDKLTEVCVDCTEDRRWRIGFANLNEQQDFAVTVRQSIEQAANSMSNVELLLANNDADPQSAIENAKRMIDAKVDLVIEYQQDERTNYVLMDMFRSAGVRVIAVDIPMPGAVYFGAGNFRAGRIAGEAAVKWIREKWQGRLDKIVCLEQSESGTIPAARVHGALVTLRQVFDLRDTDILHYDTRGGLDESRACATQALRNIPWGRNVLFVGINANSAIGALEAAEVLGRHPCTAVVSQNVSRRIRRELHARNPMLVGGVDYFPHIYGERVMPIAVKLLQGQPVLPATYTEHLFINPENVDFIYPDDQFEARVKPASPSRLPVAEPVALHVQLIKEKNV